MDWPNEEYVRLYTRETADDLELSWGAISLWRAMLTKFDRAGLIPARNGWKSIAALTRFPVEVAIQVGPELVADGRVCAVDGGFFAPNFTEAQTASKSDKVRQRESRDRRRSEAGSQVVESTLPSHEVSQPVTSGHAESHDVTKCHSPLAVTPKAKAAAEPKPKPTPPGKPAAVASDHQRAVDHFTRRYRADNNDAIHDWKGGPIKTISELIKTHGADEVIRRTDLLFDRKGPQWLKPPFTVQTLKSQWNSLATAAPAEQPKQGSLAVGRAGAHPPEAYEADERDGFR